MLRCVQRRNLLLNSSSPWVFPHRPVLFRQAANQLSPLSFSVCFRSSVTLSTMRLVLLGVTFVHCESARPRPAKATHCSSSPAIPACSFSWSAISSTALTAHFPPHCRRAVLRLLCLSQLSSGEPSPKPSSVSVVFIPTPYFIS